MNHFKLFVFAFSSLLLVSFSPAANAIVKNEKFYFKTDKQEIESLIRKAYQWIESKNNNNDFDPVENKKKDKYIGLNLTVHKKRLEDLKKTNFFSQQFLDNYNKIALKIDSNLKNKKIEWFVGELPPFGNDANPWCNCQDYPDEYWKTIAVNNLKIDNNKASFYWTWSWKGDFKYKTTVVKENGVWKIASLEGFNFDEFTKIYQ
ncbi:hypothetical protein [Flavobacterium hungaricum]|uniref:DUF3828 domain-containing protein n=1 Tax=Flavobacterium hungaricum TaxID=2082725 RepID=A0ABR9TE51_9FLAO|nr:hypothetical protein [Flavobacterium hungaricum]MBE8723629.1 hypothetical protein [Flavobacterium hungaricum]